MKVVITSRQLLYALASSLLILASSGCARLERDLGVTAGAELPRRPPHARYDELFPIHVELCAVSQFRTLEGQTGGAPGHGVMYLQGACLDNQAGYPQLRRCDEPEGELGGVGVSVNRWLKNVNWLATPGRDLFFFGGLKPGEKVDEAALQRAVDLAFSRGVFRGVTYHEYPTDASERSLRDLVERHVRGTDFAIAFARTLLCVRTPITEPMLEEVIAYLNALNRQYARTERDYHWSVYHDNCVHVLRNALAAASVWPPKPVNEPTLEQLFHVPIPANEYLSLALRTTEFPIENFDAVWADLEARDALLEFGWLPGRHGAVLNTLPALRPNAYYDTDFHLFVLEPPFGGQTQRAEALLKNPRFTDLKQNLEFYRELYRSILRTLNAGTGDLLRGTRKRPVRRRYHDYVSRQLADVEVKLEQLSVPK